MKRLVLIDAMALAYKAYFAFIRNPLKTKSGEPTSAVFGFVNQFLKIYEDLKPDYIAVAFDSKEKTVRHQMYEGYKSSRLEMPEDMVPQIKRIRELIDVFSITSIIFPGYEADDIIGTLSSKFGSPDLEVLLVTPDKDYVQLINANVKVVKPGKSGEELDILDIERVKELYGFGPEFMIDYLSLVGDSSDDIPGVKGIGQKTATELIKQFGGLDDIFNNLEGIKSKSVREKLINDRENAVLSKKLATIILDVPVDAQLEKLHFKEFDLSRVISFFEELEFRNSITRVKSIFKLTSDEKAHQSPDSNAEQYDSKKAEYKLITSIAELRKLAQTLSEKEIFTFDTETDSADAYSATLAGISFCYEPGLAFYVAVNPSGKNVQTEISVNDIKTILSPVFNNKSIRKVCQNAKYDIAVLRNYGIEVKGLFFDTMLASYILDPDQKHGMDDLARKYLNYEPIPLKSLLGDKIDPTKIFDLDLEKLAEYSAEDADVTFRLFEVFSGLLAKENLDKLATEVEFPLVNVLEDMERTGVSLDTNALRLLSDELETAAISFTSKIIEEAGEEFNVNSNQQLQKILFDKLGLTRTKKTKTGFSTDAQSLENLKGEHVIIDNILSYRQLSKLKSTYTDSLPNLISPKTGRLHTSYNQTVAATGRLSSQSPNLQNIPIRTDLGKEIRKAFVPGDTGHILLSADYSQIELRILAGICQDEALVKAFNEGGDIHRSTAALVFGVSPEQVTPEMRRKAKEVNFGILYGIGAFGLKTRLGITQQQAKEVIDTYFRTFTRVKSYMDNSVKQAREKGYAETLLGRRRYLRNIRSSNFVVRQFEERVAINMPIQGTAADMIKLAMIKIYAALNKRGLTSKMILQVHDELVFDVKKEELAEVKALVVENMQNALPLSVPIVVDTGTGDNWLDAH